MRKSPLSMRCGPRSSANPVPVQGRQKETVQAGPSGGRETDVASQRTLSAVTEGVETAVRRGKPPKANLAGAKEETGDPVRISYPADLEGITPDKKSGKPSSIGAECRLKIAAI